MHHRYPIQSNCQPTVFGRQEGFANLPHNDIADRAGISSELEGNTRRRELAGCIITVYVAGVFAVNYRELPIFHLNIRTERGPAFQSQLRGLTLRVLRLPTFRTDCYEALALITSEPGCPSFHRPGRQKNSVLSISILECR
jgi:hypothetical protein